MLYWGPGERSAMSAVHTSVYLAIIYVCFIPRIIPVFVLGPQYQHRSFFLLMSKYHLEDKQYHQKFHVGLKLDWSFYDNYWLSWKLLSFWIVCSYPFDVLLRVTYRNILVATQWPLKRAALAGSVWYGSLEAHRSYRSYVYGPCQ